LKTADDPGDAHQFQCEIGIRRRLDERMMISANSHARRLPRLGRRIATTSVGLALICCGAIFGFFFAWVSSTMWGLDAADPRVAIAAMQAMNASVRNPIFAVVFFGTPIITLLATLLSFRAGRAQAAATLLFGSALYLLGVVLTTVVFNVPLNEALAATEVPQDRAAAQIIWNEYSSPWQAFNQIRTVVAGVVLAMAAWALYSTASVSARGDDRLHEKHQR